MKKYSVDTIKYNKMDSQYLDENSPNDFEELKLIEKPLREDNLNNNFVQRVLNYRTNKATEGLKGNTEIEYSKTLIEVEDHRKQIDNKIIKEIKGSIDEIDNKTEDIKNEKNMKEAIELLMLTHVLY